MDGLSAFSSQSSKQNIFVRTYVVWRKLDKNLSIDKNLSTDSYNIRKSIELRLQHWNIKYVLHSVNIDNIGKKLTSLVLSNSLTALLKYCCMIRRFFCFVFFMRFHVKVTFVILYLWKCNLWKTRLYISWETSWILGAIKIISWKTILMENIQKIGIVSVGMN